MMKEFMDDDFLLRCETSRNLYHRHAAKMPLYDYHCHLSAKEIAEDQPFDSLGKLWLEHDHYKWRVMRACAIPEREVTGTASWLEKYLAFAKVLPYAIGNPVYHWTHLELQRYFGIDEPLDESSARRIWQRAEQKLADGSFSPKSLISRSHVHTLYTTEDPVDTLDYHRKIAESGFCTRVFPAWRPDRVLNIAQAGYGEYIRTLSDVSGVLIHDYQSLLAALWIRMDAFESVGCNASDHDVVRIWQDFASESEMDVILRASLEGHVPSEVDACRFAGTLFLTMAKEYAKRGWVMELHIGCYRNANKKGVREVGEACGFDTTGDMSMAVPLGRLLNMLEECSSLPKTVLFCLNPKDNWMLAALANTFQNETIPSRIQFGTAWWMQDHIVGMRQQFEVFATTGVFGHFIGMLTDSRSFLSYPRFEYFRRLLCEYIGELVDSGQYPSSMDFLGKVVENICFWNAERFFSASMK